MQTNFSHLRLSDESHESGPSTTMGDSRRPPVVATLGTAGRTAFAVGLEHDTRSDLGAKRAKGTRSAPRRKATGTTAHGSNLLHLYQIAYLFPTLEPNEIQIAALIRSDKTEKEIAKAMKTTEEEVIETSAEIRLKLKLSGHQDLRTFFGDLEHCAAWTSARR